MHREVEKAVRVAIDYIAIDVEGVQGRALYRVYVIVRRLLGES